MYKLSKLPTREECQDILKKTEAFFCTETVVEGQKVEMYNYRLASISDFTDNDAFELRGLTFVLDEETGIWERNILLNKFFNIGQTIGWMYDEVKDKRIVRVQNKEDGSLISFVKFKNGNVRAKSKMSFTSEQAVMAQEVYDTNKDIKRFVDDQMRHGQTPIFELVGPENQIVLEYQETELILLQMRNTHGHYHGNPKAFESYSIKVTEDFSLEGIKELTDEFGFENDLETLLHRKKYDISDIEGWVITFEDGQMAKIKTDKYLSLHGLIGPDAFRENLLIKTILDDNIDDVISALVPGAKKDRIIELSEKVQHQFNHLVVEFKELRRKYFQDFGENRKEFALNYSPKGTFPNEMFSGVMKTLNTSFRDVEQTAEKAVKFHIETRCNALGKAQDWIKGL